jgi:hypothetical protein
MSPHEDLIAFGFFALAVAVFPIWYHLYTQWRIRRENERHHRALEAAIKRLGGCAYGKGR